MAATFERSLWRYESGGRSGAWMKMRVNEGQERVIGGYTIGGKTFDALKRLRLKRNDEPCCLLLTAVTNLSEKPLLTAPLLVRRTFATAAFVNSGLSARSAYYCESGTAQICPPIIPVLRTSNHAAEHIPVDLAHSVPPWPTQHGRPGGRHKQHLALCRNSEWPHSIRIHGLAGPGSRTRP